MSIKDQHWYIPWIAVAFAALVLGTVGRQIAVGITDNIGTANLTFVIVVVGVLFLYLVFIALSDTVYQLFNRKRKADPEELADITENDISEIDQTNINDDLYPEIVVKDEVEEPNEIEPETLPASAPVKPDWKEIHEKEIQSKLTLFIEYTHLALGPYVTHEELSRLDDYIELFAREAELPVDITPIKPAKVKNPDLYHFGWNMQYYFKVGKREDVVPWLQKVFIRLRGLSPSSIKSKLHDYQTEKYIIPNIDDIPKYMAKKRG